MPMDLTDGKSTLVQVMAWCHQVTSYYLSQCWPRSLLPYGVIRPQWVNSLLPGDAIWHWPNWFDQILRSFTHVNSLAPGRFQRKFRKVILQLILVIDGWSISCKIVLKWMPMDLTDGKSTLVQVMAWCHQVTSYYLSQCWPRSLLPYGVIRPQWVCSLLPGDAIWHHWTKSILFQVRVCCLVAPNHFLENIDYQSIRSLWTYCNEISVKFTKK